MSKTSKPADLARQLNAAAADRSPDYCTGCGYYRIVNGHHRTDCTKGIHHPQPNGKTP